MKKKWMEEFDSIFKIIQTGDPLGLIEGGAPDDEYEIETLEIFTGWKNNLMNPANCLEKITEIFLRRFGENASLNKRSINTISEEILKLK